MRRNRFLKAISLQNFTISLLIYAHELACVEARALFKTQQSVVQSDSSALFTALAKSSCASTA